MADVLAEVGGGGLLHLGNNESSDLSRRVGLALGLDPSITVGGGNNLEGDVVNVVLDLSVLELATDETGKAGKRYRQNRRAQNRERGREQKLTAWWRRGCWRG